MASTRDYLGKYRLIRMIRAGATCQVWEAVDDVVHRRVALKALQPEVRRDKDEIAFLRHEFEVGKGLKHPHVIEVYDFHMEREVPFLVLELSKARNLKLMMQERGVEALAHMARKILEQASEGLYYFHSQGWVHRDIKPDNFLVSDEGDVKLIDFALAQRRPTGLSKLFGGRSKVQGTRSYMAPEQIRGKAVDWQADIYSFGCLVFEFLSGRMPFTGVSPEDLLKKHLFTPPPPLTAANQNVTQEFSDIVSRMMDKKQEGRPKSMEEFLTALRSLRMFKRQPKPPALADSGT